MERVALLPALLLSAVRRKSKQILCSHSLGVHEALRVHFLGDHLGIQELQGRREASTLFLTIPVTVLGGNQSTVDEIPKVSLGKRIKMRIQIFWAPGPEYTQALLFHELVF